MTKVSDRGKRDGDEQSCSETEDGTHEPAEQEGRLTGHDNMEPRLIPRLDVHA